MKTGRIETLMVPRGPEPYFDTKFGRNPFSDPAPRTEVTGTVKAEPVRNASNIKESKPAGFPTTGTLSFTATDAAKQYRAEARKWDDII